MSDWSTAAQVDARRQLNAIVSAGITVVSFDGIVTDRKAMEPVRMGVTIVWTLKNLYGEKFEIDKVNRLLKNDKTMAVIKE